MNYIDFKYLARSISYLKQTIQENFLYLFAKKLIFLKQEKKLQPLHETK